MNFRMPHPGREWTRVGLVFSSQEAKKPSKRRTPAPPQIPLLLESNSINR